MAVTPVGSAHPRQTEVAEVGVIGVADEHVLRLDVAVDESGGVRGVERVGDLAEERQRPRARQRPLADQLGERRPAHELHREVQPVLGLARLVHGDHVRVLERRLQPALAPEALDELGVRAELARRAA